MSAFHAVGDADRLGNLPHVLDRLGNLSHGLAGGRKDRSSAALGRSVPVEKALRIIPVVTDHLEEATAVFATVA